MTITPMILFSAIIPLGTGTEPVTEYPITEYGTLLITSIIESDPPPTPAQVTRFLYSDPTGINFQGSTSSIPHVVATSNGSGVPQSITLSSFVNYVAFTDQLTISMTYEGLDGGGDPIYNVVINIWDSTHTIHRLNASGNWYDTLGTTQISTVYEGASMAETVLVPYNGAATIYGTVQRSDAEFWRTDTHVFEAGVDADWGDYAVSASRLGTSMQVYGLPFPTLITTAGIYTITFYHQAGGSPAVSDTQIGSPLIIGWNGTNLTSSANVQLATYALNKDPATLLLQNPGNKILTDGSGDMTLGAYASGQDPATLLFTNPSNKLLTDGSGKVALTSAEHTAISTTDVPTGMINQGYTAVRAAFLDTLNGLVAAIWNATTRTLSAFGFTVNTNNVTVGNYAIGKDPATLLFINPSNKLLTDSSGKVTANATISGVVEVGSYASGQDPATLLLTNPSNKLLTDSSGRVTALGSISGVVEVGSYAAGQDPATLLLINPSNKLLTDGSGNVTALGSISGVVEVGSYATGQDPATQVLANPSNKLAADSSGNMTVGSYATGQDPATQILTNPSNKLLTDSSGHVTANATISGVVEVGSYATGQDPASLLLTNPGNKLNTDSSGNVTVGTYASGQDPATLLFAAVVDGAFAVKEILALLNAVMSGNFTTAYNVSTLTQTTIYYRAGTMTPFATMNTVYDTSGRATSRISAIENWP